MIDREKLASLLQYEPATGLLRWKVNRTAGIKAGDLAGCKDKDGYITVKVLGRQYPAHRLIWFLEFGEWTLVDHRNCDGADNRLLNLRQATQSQNCQNRQRSRNATYLKGVAHNKRDSLFSARIMKNGVSKHLGCFKTEIEAHQAYCAAARLLFGSFARTE